MAANRRLHSETSWFLYGRHTFSFDADIEAIHPFLTDLTPSTRDLVRSLSIRKQSPLRWPGSGCDPIDWLHMCYSLEYAPNLEHLQIIVEGELPPAALTVREEPEQGDVMGTEVPRVEGNGDGHRDPFWASGSPPPRPLQVSDFRLLSHIKHDSLSWVRDLALYTRGSKKLRELEVAADVQPAPVTADTTTTEAILHASFSLSIETTFVEFLKSDLGLPAFASTAFWRWIRIR
ncbi:hypothetical protein ACRALDRAFT_2040943 [Sodiomyces alcalophilus JCM 7366]|uniref:uncharacterized protein n=1 Tax=Sodiomyces alcalophilus JCM 7366 TaxID=591952 RepID=UPI0039B66343